LDKDAIVIEFLKIYFASHPEKMPDDADKAYETFRKHLKKYRAKVLDEYKQKSEKYVDRFFDGKDKNYY